jgi:hypothetical protein
LLVAVGHHVRGPRRDETPQRTKTCDALCDRVNVRRFLGRTVSAAARRGVHGAKGRACRTLCGTLGIDGLFPSFTTAQAVVASAIHRYNTIRPHYSLNLQTPHTVFSQAA